eukprot:1153330-Pelagomonas_calceolata.AAC.3
MRPKREENAMTTYQPLLPLHQLKRNKKSLNLGLRQDHMQASVLNDFLVQGREYTSVLQGETMYCAAGQKHMHLDAGLV